MVTLDAEPASEPPTVLALGTRRVAPTERLCWVALGIAMAVAAGLILYLNRGTTYFVDQLLWVMDSPHLSLEHVFEPRNGHLIATTRLTFKVVLETVGIDYLTFRILGVLTLLASVALLYAVVKRRIGALPALAPAIVLLLYGSAWQHVVVPIGFTSMLAIATGLAALLALDREDLPGDVAACAFLVVSLATFSTGLAFLVGVAVAVLIRPDRVRRSWVFLVPLALYVAWWVWALSAAGSSDSQVQLSNVLLIPSYAADSLAAITASLTGLSYGFGGESPPKVELAWGYPLAVAAVIALGFRLRRGRIPAAFWVSLAMLLAYWSLAALASGSTLAFREPWQSRFIFEASVLFLLVASAALIGIRLPGRATAVIFAVAAFSLATNLFMLRDAASNFRDAYSTPLRAQFAMLELARDHVNPAFDPVRVLPPDVSPMSSPAGPYLAAVDRYGSPALSLGQLEGSSESVREGADQVLGKALAVRIEGAPSSPSGGCREIRAGAPGAAIAFDVPRGGAVLRTRASGPASVALGRFADSATFKAEELAPGKPGALDIPVDSAAPPWRASIEGASAVAVCQR